MATAAQSAKHIFISTSRFRDLVGTGTITHQKSGQYDLDVVREEYITHQQKMAAGRGGEGGAALAKQRARLADAQASKAEFQNAADRGHFVSVELLKPRLIRDMTITREIALSTPGKISDGLTPYTAKDREAIYLIVKAQIYEMLNAMADPASYADEVIGEQIQTRKKESRR